MTTDATPSLVVTTVGSIDDARALAHRLVEQRLAACVQIHAIDSVYRWQGAVHAESEWRLLCKTGATGVDRLMAAIREQHPYQLPAIHAIATDRAEPAYAAWVAAESAGPGG